MFRMSIIEIRELIAIDGQFRFSDGEIVYAAYSRGLLTKQEVREYASEIYGTHLPDWMKSLFLLGRD